MKTERQAILVTIFLSACWGATFIFTKWAVQEMDTYTFLFLRFGLASFFFAAFFWKKLRKWKKAELKSGVFAGSMLALVLILQTEGLRFTSASNSSLITGLYLVLTPLFLAVAKKQKTSFLLLIGCITAFAGMFLLTQYNFHAANFGDFLTLLCSFACVAHILSVDAAAQKHRVVPVMLAQFATVAILCGTISLSSFHPSFHYSQQAWASIGFAVVFATLIAFGLQMSVQRILDPTRAGLLFALESVFGPFFGWWLGGETMTNTAFAGACLMVVGMVIAESKPVVNLLRNKLIG